MSKLDPKEIIKEAAEIAAVAPKHLQEVAFNRAIDLLTKHGTGSPSSGGTKKKDTKKPKATSNTEHTEDPTTILLSKLDRTAHEDILNASKVLERSLFLLRAARDDHAIDGLTGPQIAEILTQKFRLGTTRQAVYGALNSDSAKRLVDARNAGAGSTYHLMHPGDQYLDAGDFNQAPRGSSTRTKKKITKKKPIKKKTAVPSSRANSKAPDAAKLSTKKSSKKKPLRNGRPGPGAMLSQLASEGFFNKSRSIADIQNYCEATLAHKYTLQDLSTPLRRAVHNKLLKREKNDEGQYEYSTP